MDLQTHTVLVLASFLFLSCGPGDEAPVDEPAEASEPSGRQTYEGVGTVVEIQEDAVVLDHDDIPNFMDAMSMTYPVSDPSILEGLEKGMVVSFRVVVDGQSYAVDRIEPGAEREQS